MTVALLPELKWTPAQKNWLPIPGRRLLKEYEKMGAIRQVAGGDYDWHRDSESKLH